MGIDRVKLAKLIAYADMMASIIIDSYATQISKEDRELAKEYQTFRKGKDATDGEGNTPVVPEVQELESSEPTHPQVSSLPEE